MARRPSFPLAFVLGLFAFSSLVAQEATDSPSASPLAPSPAQTPAPASSQAPDAVKIYLKGRDFETAGKMAEAVAKYQEAVTICNQELQTSPGRMEAYVVKSWCQLRMKSYADTIATGLAALKVGTDGRILEVLGEAFFYQTDMESSLRYFQRYVDITPENGDKVATAYYFMGEAYAGLSKLDHADIAFAMAVYMSPKSYRWWYRYGVLRERRGEKDLAVKAYEQAISISPGYADAIGARDRLKTPQ